MILAERAYREKVGDTGNISATAASTIHPASWSYCPADTELEKAYEEASLTRTPAPPELFTRYNALCGSLRNAVK